MGGDHASRDGSGRQGDGITRRRLIGNAVGATGTLALAQLGVGGLLAPPAHASGIAYVRRFDGIDDQLRVSIGGCAITGAITLVALVRPDVVTGDHDLISLHTSGGAANGYELFQRGSAIGLWDGNVERVSANGALSTTEWRLVAITKAAGTAVPRFHWHDFDSSTWTHANGAGNAGTPSSVTGGTVRFGAYQSMAFFDGDYAAAAIYAAALSDPQVEDLAAGLQDWLGLSPAGMWVFNQRHISYRVLDETGSGADQTVRAGTTAVQDTIPLTDDPSSLIFNGDFDTGDGSQWDSLQLVGSTAAFSVVSSSPTPAEGSHCGRFALQSGDERAEVLKSIDIVAGEDLYFHWQTRLASGFPVVSAWQLVWQLHQAGGSGSPPVALYVKQDGSNLRWHMDSPVLVNDWWSGPVVQTDRWYEFTVRVLHSTDAQVGFVELWLDGASQTLSNGQTRLYGPTMADSLNYPKLGYYRDTSISTAGVVYHDAYRIAYSYADAVG